MEDLLNENVDDEILTCRARRLMMNRVSGLSRYFRNIADLLIFNSWCRMRSGGVESESGADEAAVNEVVAVL
ncbi:hypothetical protein, partial [Saccharothrix syringae]|uniref:hypothetical protein n=1 Tax=Saccharothrix syringae TaxID=103733 RepID=UPI001B7FFD97